MKRIFISIFAIIAVSSCNGFLEETPTTSLQTSCYSSEEMLEANALGIILQFSGTWVFTGEPAEFFSIASGLTHWAGTSRLNKPKWDSALEFTQFATTEVNNYFFKNIYGGIEACNVLIRNLQDSPVDENYKREIEAEAHFYRAVFYFSAVQIWGDLPLRMEPASVASSTFCPRVPFYRIYENIVSDLEYAEKYMRTPERAKDISPEVPRPNRYAATAYLSSVYTTIGSLLSDTATNFWDSTKDAALIAAGREPRTPDFSKLGISSSEDAYRKALEYAEKLIPESGSYDSGSSYRLCEKFSDLFNFDPNFSRNGYDSWMNPEQIFVLTFSPTASATSYMANRTLPTYPEGARQGSASSNNGRWRPNRWVFQKWCETYPGEQETRELSVKISGTTYTKPVTLYLDSEDPRLFHSFYYGERSNGKTGAFVTFYPQLLNTSCGATDQCRQVFPYFKKYWSTTYNNNEGSASYYVMRFAEVYLNAAEAAASLGEDEKAYKYIEVLHARARHSVLDGRPDSPQPRWTSGQFASGKELLNAIFWERIFELIGEGHEWNETHRHGAQWLVDNIAVPKNAFLDRWEQDALIQTGCCLYPKNFRYSIEVDHARKGLLASFPYTEMLYNNGIPLEDQNDFFVQ